MKKITEWLMDSNHYKHLLGCLFIALGACIITYSPNILISFLIGMYTATVAGVAVEWIQSKMGGKFDLQDLLACEIGGVLGIFIFYLLKLV